MRPPSGENVLNEKLPPQRLTPRAITAQNAVSGEFRSGDVNDGLSLVQGRRFAQDPSGPRHFTERVFPVELDELQFPHHPVEALTNCVRPISVKRVVSLWMIGEFVATRVQFDSERYGFLRFEVRKTERGDTSGPLPQGQRQRHGGHVHRFHVPRDERIERVRCREQRWPRDER
jgi:hypothetical protein